MQTPAKLTIGIFLAAGMFVAGYMANRQPAAVASAASLRQVQYYSCPMHPQYRSDHAGDCPSCGMRLVPVYAGGASQAEAAPPGLPGLVGVTAAQQQLIGVRTDVAQRAPSSSLLRVAGRIAPDDTRVYRLTAATDGWVRELGRNPAGAFIKQNEVLASYYVRELLVAEQNYLYRFDENARLEQTPANAAPQRNSSVLNLRTALDALLALGMTDRHIQELRRTRELGTDIRVYSPVTGFVLTRDISPGQRFDKGAELFRIADISHVWVMADIFEKDREFLTPGVAATVRYRGREFRAHLSDLPPQFDPQSRALKTRFELDNPGYFLRPDMFVDVEVHVNMPSAITVPADAVIDSGRRQTVYVDRGGGFFEPRLVKTGWRLGDRVQVTEGLEAGERIVVASNFLIDSESRMKSASSAPPAVAHAAAGKDPVCGMEVDPKAPNAIHVQHAGKTYTFCSAKCKKDFEAAPGKYVPGIQPAPDDSGMRGTQ